MFERETRREKILEARNRELRLKHRVRSSTILDDQKEKEPSEIAFVDSYVVSAETEFYQIIKEETKDTKGISLLFFFYTNRSFGNFIRCVYEQ